MAPSSQMSLRTYAREATTGEREVEKTDDGEVEEKDCVCINTNDHQTSFPVLIIVIPSHAFMKYSQFASSSAPSFIS